MTTYGDLINSIHTSLHSYSGTQEVLTWLTASCDADDTTLTVASSDVVLRGIAEIEDELIYVHTSDSNGLTLPPFGRGFRGSTAAAHDADLPVIFDPIFPRVEIKRSILQCIESLYPTLYQIKSTTATYSAIALGYEMPADCDSVLAISVQAPEGLDWDEPITRWKFEPNASDTFATGKALNIYDIVRTDAEILVTYKAKFTAFADVDDTFEDVGLSESYADLILYGTTARMIRFLDPARLQVGAMENVARSQVVASGDASKIANQLYTMYQQRLAEERSRLLELNPPQINFTR